MYILEGLLNRGDCKPDQLDILLINISYQMQEIKLFLGCDADNTCVADYCDRSDVEGCYGCWNFGGGCSGACGCKLFEEFELF